MNNSIEEINKLETELRQTEQYLKNNEEGRSLIASLKLQRNILAFIALLFLAALIFGYIFSKNNFSDNVMDDKNVSLISNDSLFVYRQAYADAINGVNSNTEIETKSLKDEKVIYTVQIGAFKDFNLASDGLINLSEFNEDGFNKFSLGNYKTYAEAKSLKDSLKKIGFRDCFLTARSYGNAINIREALLLSNEPQFLEQ